MHKPNLNFKGLIALVATCGSLYFVNTGCGKEEGDDNKNGTGTASAADAEKIKNLESANGTLTTDNAKLTTKVGTLKGEIDGLKKIAVELGGVVLNADTNIGRSKSALDIQAAIIQLMSLQKDPISIADAVKIAEHLKGKTFSVINTNCSLAITAKKAINGTGNTPGAGVAAAIDTFVVYGKELYKVTTALVSSSNAGRLKKVIGWENNALKLEAAEVTVDNNK